jgi:hypothetical protein
MAESRPVKLVAVEVRKRVWRSGEDGGRPRERGGGVTGEDACASSYAYSWLPAPWTANAYRSCSVAPGYCQSSRSSSLEGCSRRSTRSCSCSGGEAMTWMCGGAARALLYEVLRTSESRGDSAWKAVGACEKAGADMVGSGGCREVWRTHGRLSPLLLSPRTP